MTPHQANLFFIAEYVLTILILAFSAYRKNAFDWRKTIRRKTFIKRMLFLIPVALIAIGIMTAAYLLQLPQKGQQKGQRNEEGERIRNGLAELHARKTQHPGQYKNQRDKAHALLPPSGLMESRRLKIPIICKKASPQNAQLPLRGDAFVFDNTHKKVPRRQRVANNASMVTEVPFEVSIKEMVTNIKRPFYWMT